MDDTRRGQLDHDVNLNLTLEEILQGYHFCPDWDFLLVGPEDVEAQCCNCRWEGDWKIEDFPLTEGQLK